MCYRHSEQSPTPPHQPASEVIVISDPEPHQKAGSYKFYSRGYTLDETVALVNLVVDSSLNGEVAAARVAVRRIIDQLGNDLSPAEYARLASLVFTGTQAVARLLRAQRFLSGEVAENISKWLDSALDQVSKEFGIDL